MMPQLDLFKQDGTKVGAVEANEAVFGIEPNQHVLFQAVTLQRASLRQGTHKTKGRSEVSGGGRKPWRQKEQVVLVKDLSVHHNGVEVELYSDLHHVATASKCLVKCVV